MLMPYFGVTALQVRGHVLLLVDVLLLEDGLLLWLVTLRHAPAPFPDLLSLFPNWAAAMERSTEHIAVGMRIAASCVLLGGAPFLQAYGGLLVRALTGFVGNVKERGMLTLLPALEVVLQVCGGGGAGLSERPGRASLVGETSHEQPGAQLMLPT